MAHHRRRLQRVGWAHALDSAPGSWAERSAFARSAGNAVEVLVDGADALVGGIDLTSYAGDRLDSSIHPARPGVGWHDAAALLRGPAVADVAEHFLLRWRELTGEDEGRQERPPRAGELDVQLV